MKSRPSEISQEGSVPTPTDEPGIEVAAKKRRKKKKRSKEEGKDSAESDDKKDGIGSTHMEDKKCKQPDETGEDDAMVAKKAKKERKKEGKRKAKSNGERVESS